MVQAVVTRYRDRNGLYSDAWKLPLLRVLKNAVYSAGYWQICCVVVHMSNNFPRIPYYLFCQFTATLTAWDFCAVVHV